MDVSEVIVYLRKSRSDDPLQSVEEVLQKHEQILQDFSLSQFGFTIPEDRIFREVVSGETIKDRPVMVSVLKLIESDKIKAVLVVEPQRLSRGDLEDCGKIVNSFRYSSTLVITPTKTYNLFDEYDRKFFEMELTRGNDYLEYIKKILNRGRIASVMQGNYIGSRPAYGYSKIKVGTGKDAHYTLDIVPDQADAVRLMFKMYCEGSGFATIAKALDDYGIKPLKSSHWSPAAISDMLSNPVYIGKIRWNQKKTVKKIVNGQISNTRPVNKDDPIIIDGKHPAIIDESVFYAAQERRGKTPKIKRFNELQNPFAGLLYCQCGTSMSLKRYKSKSAHSDTVTQSMICNDQTYCHTKSVSYLELEERIIYSIESMIKDFEIQLKDSQDNALQEALIRNLENELEKLSEKDYRQKDAYEDGIYTKEEYMLRNAKLQEEICKAQDALKNAKANVSSKFDLTERIYHFKDCLSALCDDSIPAAAKNSFLKSCIEKIVYTNKMPGQRGIGKHVHNEFSIDIFLRF